MEPKPIYPPLIVDSFIPAPDVDSLAFVDDDIRQQFEGKNYHVTMPLLAQQNRELSKLTQAILRLTDVLEAYLTVFEELTQRERDKRWLDRNFPAK